ncbi:MAG: TIGR03960 family B12-binding radical SAM protein [Clostridiaceae bacterium]
MNRISDDILYRVEKPARYIGGEYNSVYKDLTSVDIRFAFCFPDVYEVGMSHLGTRILYYILNQREDTYCERAFAPWTDMEKLLIDNNIPLGTLETKDPLSSFDFLGFTLQYEMSYTNILNMLSLSNIPLRSEDRDDNFPIVLFGGPCAYNPEPLYNIADLFVIGEGEEVTGEILDTYKKSKGREDFLKNASKIKGVYVPSLYTVSYNEDKTIKEFTPKYDFVPKKVVKRIVSNFNEVDYPDKLVVPYTEIVHDRIMLETFRGCSRGCRFCQAGMIYRPIREKKTDKLLELLDKIKDSTGYDEVSLTSLSICDYSDIGGLVNSIIEKYKEDKFGVSLPSIRIDSFYIELLNEIQKVRKTGLTFAPEAGTQRMRDIINKGVTEEDLLNSAASAFNSGYSTIKLYTMVGLPYETEEDVAGIADMADKVVREYYKVPKDKRKNGLRVNVSSSIFVPKPFTPFQWIPQDDMGNVLEKVKKLKANIKERAVSYTYHETKVSYLEAIFARGDRRLSNVLIRAFEKGAKFDGWSEYFNYDIWMESLKEEGIDGDFYAKRERCYDEILPWDFIDIGVSKKYLISENEKAKKAELTCDCRQNCSACGINCSEVGGECFEGAILNKVH